MIKLIYITLTVVVVASCLTSSTPNPNNEYIRDPNRVHLELEGEDKLDIADNNSDMDNKLFSYDPLVNKLKNNYGSNNNNIRSNLFVDLERESSSNVQGVVASKPDLVKIKVAAVPSLSDQVNPDITNLDRIKSIAFNSREIRLVGPDLKEVEMKDDVPTKFMIALDNLQKEASDVWGQVNEKLDKGWTELKTMVEKAAAPSLSEKKSPPSSRQLREVTQKASSLVQVSDVDGLSMADEDSIKNQADSAGTKIKGFFSNIGLNEDNQKKASDALSKAGTSVSDTVTKDLPDALKKAGNAVSDAVTNDIPNAFKNFFG